MAVCYDGEDLPEVAALSGLSVSEVIRQHSGEVYTVRALGFLAGFPYMETTPAPLHLPRRPTPRAEVPPHSVAIAGSQTGIYPVAAPGGWRLLGRTLIPVYDPQRPEPFLLRPGQRVRFRPVSEAPALPAPQPRLLWPPAPQQPLLHVRRPGALGLLVDRGRARGGPVGLVRSGPLDGQAAALANALLDNPPDAALLEFHLTGPHLDVLGPGVLAWAGAGLDAFLNGWPLTPHSSFVVQPGDQLSFRPNGAGRVTYLAVQGGLETAPFRGSASPDLRAFLGRPVRAGDVFGSCAGGGEAGTVGGRHFPRQFTPYRCPDAPLRLLPVADGEALDPQDVAALCCAPLVLRDLDRMAARLVAGLPSGGQQTGGQHTGDQHTERLRLRGGEIHSEGCPVGTLQVPPSGEVMVLLCDKGTLGGYRKPARIHPDDLPRLVQKLPGAQVRFVPG